MSVITNQGAAPGIAGKDGEEFIAVTFLVQRKRLPALRSALADVAGRITDQLSKNLPHPKAQALTNAVIGLAAIRKATFGGGYDEWYDR